MNFYIKSALPPKDIKTLLNYYLLLNANSMSKTLNNSPLNEFINTNYDLSIYDILRAYIDNVFVTTLHDDVLVISNRRLTLIKNKSLDGLIGLLEFGNSEIRPPKIISSLMNASLRNLDSELEGV